MSVDARSPRAEAVDGPISLTVALPIFNEGPVLRSLHLLLEENCARATPAHEILYIDDGSSDDSPAILEELAYKNPRVSVVTLSRNFGHPAALSAAIDFAKGESVILMDADLQDAPSAIPEFCRLQREQGADVVYAVRARRQEGLLLRLLFSAFHWLIARSSTYTLPRDVGSFGLLGPRALLEMRRLKERLRYLPGIRAFVGLKQVALSVPRGARYDRVSRVGLRGLVRLAAVAFFSQSRAPVNLFYALSAASMVAALALIAYALVSKALGIAVVAWASTLTAVAFFSSVIILGQAFICEYLARIYEEVRQRPIYVVDRVLRAHLVQERLRGDTQSS